MANPQAGTSYTNLGKIIAANQNNQLGNTIQGGVQKGISGLNTNLAQNQQQFQTDVNNANLNTTANQQNIQNTINSIIPQAQTAPQQTINSSTAPPSVTNQATYQYGQQVQATPATPAAATTTPSASSSTTPTAAPAVTSTPDTSAPGSFGATATSGANNTAAANVGIAPTAGQLSQFGTYLQGGYTGPTQLANYSNLLGQAQNLQQQGQNAITPGGLQSLLQQYVGGNNYTQGEQNLDTILLGQTGGKQLQNVLGSTQNLANNLQSTNAQDTAAAQAAALGNQQLASYAQNQLTGAQNNILQNIQANLNPIATQNAGYNAVANQIMNYLNTASANPTAGNGTIGTVATTTTNSASPNLNGVNQGAPTTVITPSTAGIRGIGPQVSGTGIGGAMNSNPQTDQAAALAALNLAKQAGLGTAADYTNISNLIPKIASTGQYDLKNLLSQSFSNPAITAPTLQQEATAQQAAQLNALEQLGGLTPEFQTYGGAAPTNTGFNLNTFDALAAANPYSAPAPPVQGKASWGSPFAKGGTVDYATLRNLVGK